MAYAIHVRVIQTDPNMWWSIVEKTVWKSSGGGTWSEYDGLQMLSLGCSGTSGCLRLKNPQGEYVIASFGIHSNQQRWCDIRADLSDSNTGIGIHPEYYSDGRHSEVPVKQQHDELQKASKKGTRFTIEFYKVAGNTFYATFTIESN